MLHAIFFYILEVFYIKPDFLINEQIRVIEVQLVDNEGQKVGVMTTKAALALAYEKELDLVLIAPNGKPPVCKILDYGKFKFEMIKKEKESKKKQKVVEIKEIRLSPKIDKHDLEVKAKNANKFIAAGDKVKVTLRFRGRELSFVNTSKAILDQFAELLEDATIEKQAKLEGKSMIMIVSPKQK
ncbi:MAG: translation initiation factor IF-3 [Clostridia bacterium]